jgi:hypothetical protein
MTQKHIPGKACHNNISALSVSLVRISPKVNSPEIASSSRTVGTSRNDILLPVVIANPETSGRGDLSFMQRLGKV